MTFLRQRHKVGESQAQAQALACPRANEQTNAHLLLHEPLSMALSVLFWRVHARAFCMPRTYR